MALFVDHGHSTVRENPTGAPVYSEPLTAEGVISLLENSVFHVSRLDGSTDVLTLSASSPEAAKVYVLIVPPEWLAGSRLTRLPPVHRAACFTLTAHVPMQLIEARRLSGGTAVCVFADRGGVVVFGHRV